MPTVSPCLIRSVGPAGDPEVSLGVPLLDEYLEFLSGRCRPNTVLAVAYDLKVFFTAVGKSPKRVRPADVLAFMTAQRTGHGSAAQTVQPVDGERVGVSTRTLRRRLRASRVCTRFCMPAATWRPTRFRVACRPAGNDTDQDRAFRWSAGPGLYRGSSRRPRSTRSPAPCAATGTGRWSRRWCSVVCAVAR
jgi:hypothetical protein